MTPDEARIVKETSHNALLLATKTSEQITALQNMQQEQMTAMQHIVGEAVNQMAEHTEVTRKLSVNVERALTENSYTKTTLEKTAVDVERHNMSERAFQEAAEDVKRLVSKEKIYDEAHENSTRITKKEATYDKTSFNQAKAMWAIWGLIASVILLIVKEFTKQ